MTFESQYYATVERLSALLGFDVLKSGRAGNHLARMVAHALKTYRKGTGNPLMELAKLQFLEHQLGTIKAVNESAFAQFKTALRKFGGEPYYFGVRAEIYVASHLSKRGISYLKRESPDFEIQDQQNESAYIECGSTHLTSTYFKKDAPPDESYKLSSLIKGKATKPYANRATLLFCDVTNIVHAGAAKTSDPSKSNLLEVAEQLIEDSTFGSIIFANYVLNHQADQYQLHYRRIDSKNIAPRLETLLETAFPEEPIRMSGDFTFPSMV